MNSAGGKSEGNPGRLRRVSFGKIDVAAPSNWDEILAQVFESDGGMRSGFAMAVNPEKLVALHDDRLDSELFESVTLAYPDGIGVVAAMRLRGARSARRFPGIELWRRITAKSEATGASVFFIGGRSDHVEGLRTALNREHPNLRIVGLRDGYFKEEDWDSVAMEIRQAAPDFVAVGMGSPLQERFIVHCRSFHSRAFYMGVGGSFDVFTGRVKRAPAFFRTAGLEWLYRLWRQPGRIFRQVNLLRFMALVISKKI